MAKSCADVEEAEVEPMALSLTDTSSSSSSSDTLLSLPLLKDLDCESVLISTHLSHSSSSSGHEHEDLLRLSLDSDKPNPNPISIHRNPNPAHPRIRLVKLKASTFDNNNQRSSMDHLAGAQVGRSPIRKAPREAGRVGNRGVSMDSPRMNSSGKIVFQSLGRSSSSPSSFNGGPRFKHRGMEWSYFANVRVTPVLNVPVCSLRGSSKMGLIFGLGNFSLPHKRKMVLVMEEVAKATTKLTATVGSVMIGINFRKTP